MIRVLPRYPGRRIDGFTLIELLAVILIIGVLTAVLLPVLSHLREGAKGSRCSASLRVVFHAANQFAADNQGYYPAARFHATASDPAKGRRNRGGGYHWEAELAPYIGTNLRSVASSDGLFRFAVCSEGWTGMNGGIVVGTDGAGNQVKSLDYQYKPMLIEFPSRTVMAGDSDDYHLGIWRNMQPDADGRYTSGDPVRHAGRANYLFFDGHVRSLSLEDALRMRWY